MAKAEVKEIEVFNSEWFNCENDSYFISEDLEALKEEYEDKNLVLVGGSAGTWQGRKEYKMAVAGNLEDALDNICSWNDLKITTEGKYINIYATHHDGTNNYYFKDMKDLTKAELKEIIDGSHEFDIIDAKKYLKESWEVPYNKAPKNALIDAIEQFDIGKVA